MDMTRTENLPPPPEIINSIKSGFDTIATHITAILFPLLLNLFLWLGPRLRMNALFNLIKTDVISQAGSNIPAAELEQIMGWYEMATSRINLFWMLRTIPIGVSSLPFSDATASSPLGVPSVLEVSAFNLFGWMFLIALVGWICGGLYFWTVSWLAIGNKETGHIGIGYAIAQTFLLSILWGIFLMIITMPIMLVLALLAQIAPFLAQIFIVVISLGSIWIIAPLYFWSHGIFVKKQNAFLSIWSSIQMTRFTLPTSGMFVLTVFLLAFGLNLLWTIPAENSWMMLVGIFGHSFVSTALLASSFIYYRDANIWTTAVMDKLKSKIENRA
jgi:hypothetical protein